MTSPSLASPAPDLRSPKAVVNLEAEAHILKSIMSELQAEDFQEQDAEFAAKVRSASSNEELLREENIFGMINYDSEEDDVSPSLKAGKEPAAFLAERAVPMIKGELEGDDVLSPSLKTGKERAVPLADVPRQAGELSSLFLEFKCRCSPSQSSCLIDLTAKQMLAARRSVQPDGEDTPVGTFRKKLHEKMWQMKVLLQTANRHGHNYKVVEWKYDGKHLCRPAWMKLMGGAYQAHREMYAFTLRGISPEDVQSKKGAELRVKAATSIEGDETERAAFATNWLHTKFLNTMEWMPNENRIVIRGLPLLQVWELQYKPEAERSKMKLSYKQFADQMKPAAILCAQQHCPGQREENEKVKFGRSARHSKFPNCTQCTDLQQDYLKVSSNPLADKGKVQQVLELWLSHQRQFMANRAVARQIRFAAHPWEAEHAYEGDDKCGSHWCKGPTPEGGRDSKFTTTRMYDFAVQANVICGPFGLMRMAIVPKTIKTGANFGLSTLLLALWSAQSKEKLPNHKWRLYRHTDGGSDNVSKTTHLFNWLLVYIGCWEEIVWFMFDAGHSHTEVADRLFSLMKRLFESNNHSAAGCVQGGILSFEDLEDRLKAAFSKNPEWKEIVYHFANWDITNWLKQNIDFKEDDLKYIAFDKVYRYTYVGGEPCKLADGTQSNMAAAHGGVRVTYKRNLSDSKLGPLEDEWLPIVTVTEFDASGEKVEANRTAPQGVRFVKKPPDLRSAPKREGIEDTCVCWAHSKVLSNHEEHVTTRLRTWLCWCCSCVQEQEAWV